MDIDPRDLIKLPSGVGASATPPAEILEKLHDLEKYTVCGGRDQFTWGSGPQKGLAVTGYCAEPLCMDTGVCPAPRFVPHQQQSTHLDTENPLNRDRKMLKDEAVDAVKELNGRARERGARPDGRSHEQIWEHLKLVRDRQKRATQIGGQWRAGGGGVPGS